MKISPQVIYELQRATICGSQVQLTQQLSRPLYMEVNRVLMCLGGEWNKKAKAHVFDGDAGDLIAEAVATGEVTDAKKEFQFFETPIELARRMVKLAGIKPEDRILEPSAGKGGILEAIFESGPRYRRRSLRTQSRPSGIFAGPLWRIHRLGSGKFPAHAPGTPLQTHRGQPAIQQRPGRGARPTHVFAPDARWPHGGHHRAGLDLPQPTQHIPNSAIG